MSAAKFVTESRLEVVVATLATKDDLSAAIEPLATKHVAHFSLKLGTTSIEVSKWSARTQRLESTVDALSGRTDRLATTVEALYAKTDRLATSMDTLSVVTRKMASKVDRLLRR